MSTALTVSSLPCLLASLARAADEKPAPPLFQRVAIVGASVSAGFCTDEFFGGKRTPEFRLVNFFNEALTCQHEPIVSRASKTLFLSARKSLEKQITDTIASKPSMVIGLDSLFWCCYGSNLSPEQRLELFEFGLTQLDRIEQRLIVGDLPDARHAIGKILSAEEVPPAEILAKCNERLKAWAATKKNITLFPFAAMMTAAVNGQALELGGRTWEKGSARTLLQHDLLHPSHLGLAAITVATLDAAGATVDPPIARTLYRRDLESLTTDSVQIGVKQSQEAEAKRKEEAKPVAPAPSK